MVAKIGAPSTYAQYKNDTAVFLTWLLQAAQACGYELPATGHSQKVTRQPSDASVIVSNLNVPVKEIISQARCICVSQQPLLQLPLAIARFAQRAIDVRRSFTARFSAIPIDGATDRALVASNETHQHFTRVLEEALQLLEKGGNVPQAPASMKQQSDSQESITKLSNLFSVLEIEECEDSAELLDHLNQASQRSDHLKGSTNQSKVAMVDVDDVRMRLFCFFDDLHELRAQVGEVWNLYKTGTIQLIPAAMTTNAAIALVEQMEKDLLSSLPSAPDLKNAFEVRMFDTRRPYASIIGLLSKAVTGHEVLDPAFSCSSIGSLWFADVGFILSKLGWAYNDRASRQMDMSRYCGVNKTTQNLAQRGWKPWPRVLTSEVQAWIASKQTERMLSHPNFDKIQQMDRTLTPIVMDTLLRREQLESDDTFDRPRSKGMDEATRALLSLKGPSLKCAAIFAAALLYDLSELKLTRPYDELRDFAQATWDKVKYATHNAENRRPKSGHVWIGQDAEFLGLLEMCKVLVIGEPPYWSQMKAFGAVLQPSDTFKMQAADAEFFAQFMSSLGLSSQDQQARVQRIHALSHVCILPDEDESRVWVGNPLACGTMMHNIAIAYEQAGVCLANYHLSVLWVAYLYAAVKNKSGFEGQWPQLDQVIDAHLSSMFFGSIPQTPTSMHNTFVMRLGVNPAMHSKNSQINVLGKGGDRTGKLPLQKAKASCLPITDTAHAFGLWLQGDLSFVRLLYTVNDLMAAKSNRSSKKCHVPRSQIQPLEFLEPFCKHIMHDCERFAIDYVGLVRECSELLQALLDAKAISLPAQAYDSNNYRVVGPNSRKVKMEDTASNTNNPVFVHLVKNILWEDKEWEQAQPDIKALSRKGKHVGRVSWIQIAGEWCHKYLSERGMLSMTTLVRKDATSISFKSLPRESYDCQAQAQGMKHEAEQREMLIKQAENVGCTVHTAIPMPKPLEQGETESQEDRIMRMLAERGLLAFKGADGRATLLPFKPGDMVIMPKSRS